MSPEPKNTIEDLKKKIQEMIKLMEENGLQELEIETEGIKIRLKKGVEVDISSKIPASSPQTSTSTSASKTSNLIEVKAPMVGTFYRAPSPQAKPFVEVGDTVEEGDVLCIIEAMKLMNEIKSECKGKIVEILVENGDPVEFGQVLFLIEPLS